MRTEEASLVIPATKPSSHSDHPRQLQHRPRFLLSPLWLCLLFALLIRIWLVVHTRGVIAGDEAMVGIQAEHILQGEHPVYYYGQPYMGSLEAYFAALLFAIAGASVWSHGWLGDPISFKTNTAIKTSDPRFLTQNPPWLGRLPNYTLPVMHADRPSILTMRHEGLIVHHILSSIELGIEIHQKDIRAIMLIDVPR